MVYPIEISSKQSYWNYRNKYVHYEHGVTVNSDDTIHGYQLRLKALEEMFKDDQLNPMVYMNLSMKVLEEQIQSLVRMFFAVMGGWLLLYYLTR
jgi:hypothetical protein